MFVFVDVVVVVQSAMHNSATKSVNPTKPIVFKKAEDCFLARLHFFSFAPRFRFFVVANKGRVFCWFLLQKKIAFLLLTKPLSKVKWE